MDLSRRGCAGGFGHAKIAKMVLVLTIAVSPVFAAPEGVSGVRPVSELKSFLDRKERELTAVSAERLRRMQEMEKLALDVEARKKEGKTGWLSQKLLERKMAKLRVQAGNIKELSDRERDIRDDALAGASAVVTELEGQLEVMLVELRDHPPAGAARKKLVDQALGLERERKHYHGRMGALMPGVRVPPDLPRGAEKDPGMLEDQRRNYEAAIARMQAERDVLAQEKRLGRLLAEAIPGGLPRDERLDPGRVDARMKVLDREIRECRGKLAKLPATPVKAE